jgi:hypothetical protein
VKRLLLNLIVTQILIFNSCEYYEHSNPLDPKYKGGITKNLKIHSYVVYDPIGVNLPYSGGNADSIINKGELLKIFIKLINLGNSIEKNISATPQLITNANIQITDYYLNYGDILPNEISDGNIYTTSMGRSMVELKIDKSVLPNTSFMLLLNFSDRIDTLNLLCEQTGANLINDGVEVSYTLPSGNQYCFIPDYKIKNVGTSMTRLVTITYYSSNDTNISFSTSSTTEIGDLKTNESKSSGFFTPEIVVPNSLNFPYNTSVTIKLEDLFGNTWSLDYELTLEK